jgi:hypothetical protein
MRIWMIFLIFTPEMTRVTAADAQGYPARRGCTDNFALILMIFPTLDCIPFYQSWAHVHTGI